MARKAENIAKINNFYGNNLIITRLNLTKHDNNLSISALVKLTALVVIVFCHVFDFESTAYMLRFDAK